MDAQTRCVFAVNAIRVNGFVSQVPCESGSLILAQVKDFGANDDVTGMHVRLKAAAEAGADNQVGPVAVDGHLGSDAGAFLADAERQQCHGLASERTFVEVEMFLADDVVGVGATQDGLEFLANGNKDGDHGFRRLNEAPRQSP